ncbi:MAG: glucose 1-dehydrogenase [Proteobacteria bacterium]|nr:glucose 1-dehydrogenase [Pseudomonadota bacterium]MDA1023017.1 glucose 1-dehydrogenase [Pseudomonadota bacterium]
MRLENKSAIVTGGGSGFGEGIARRFAEEGANVLVADIDASAAARVAGDIGGQWIKTDVSDGPQVEAMMSKAKQLFGGLNILVNNAGIAQPRQPMLEVDEETFDRVYAVNVKSIYWAAIHGVALLKEQPGGVIINTASTAAVSPRPGLTWYNGSKGAVVTLTKSMAAELAPDGIRVNAINPVIGETALTEQFMGGDTPALREKFIATIPLGRMSTPLDVANAALYLASDEAEFITGVCLEVDGGRCI